jgi:hypothetical protein
MSFLDKKPEPFRRGQDGPLSARVMNEIIRAVIRQIRGGNETDVGYYGDRLTVESQHNQGYLSQLANYFMQWTVLSEVEDALLCTPFQQPADNVSWLPQYYYPDNGQTPQGQLVTNFFVAKPYQLQQTPWNGKQVTLNGQLISFNYTGIGTRTVTSVNTTPIISEMQVIVPDYMPGDVIFAVRVPTGYMDFNLNVPIAWMDINTAARAWAKVS